MRQNVQEAHIVLYILHDNVFKHPNFKYIFRNEYKLKIYVPKTNSNSYCLIQSRLANELFINPMRFRNKTKLLYKL